MVIWASTASKGHGAWFTYIDDCVSIKNFHVFDVVQSHWNCRFCPLEVSLQLPWDFQYIIAADFCFSNFIQVIDSAIDLGIYTWQAESLGELEVVEVECFSEHIILVTITSHGHNIWVIVPYDHVNLLFYNKQY